MKKISVLTFCFFLLWGCSLSLASIARESDGDNIAFSSWQKFTDNHATTYCSLVKYIDLGASPTFWLRMDSNRGTFQEHAYLQIDNNILQIKRLEADTMYNRTGTPDPAVLSPWRSTMYVRIGIWSAARAVSCRRAIRSCRRDVPQKLQWSAISLFLSGP